MNEFYIKLSARLKEYRKKHKFKQYHFAEALNIDPVLYCKVEKAQRKLSVEELMILKNKFNFPLRHTDLL